MICVDKTVCCACASVWSRAHVRMRRHSCVLAHVRRTWWRSVGCLGACRALHSRHVEPLCRIRRISGDKHTAWAWGTEVKVQSHPPAPLLIRVPASRLGRRSRSPGLCCQQVSHWVGPVSRQRRRVALAAGPVTGGRFVAAEETTCLCVDWLVDWCVVFLGPAAAENLSLFLQTRCGS